MMGGYGGEEFVAPSPNGEAELVPLLELRLRRERRGGGARRRARPSSRRAWTRRRRSRRRAITTIEGLAEFLGVDPAATAKAMPIVVGGKVVLALVRGDHRLHELKTAERPRRAVPAGPAGRDPGDVRGRSRARSGRSASTCASSPTSRCARASSSAARTAPAGTCAASRPGATITPSSPTCARSPRATPAPSAAPASLHIEPAIEVGHIFKLGTRYSVPLNATYLDEAGKEHPIVMGSYGIGPARVSAAAVEQHHDEEGIVVAGEPGAVPRAHGRDRRRATTRSSRSPARSRRELERDGLTVLFDDRAASPGSRFADAELIGMPARVTVGKRTATDGTADVQVRRGREQRTLAVADVPAAVRAAVDAA